jgi:hypothetical protein
MIRHVRPEPVDVAAAAGIVATCFGAILLFLSTHGSFHAGMGEQVQPKIAVDTKSLIESEIGEAVMAASVIENKHSNDIVRAAKKLNTETMTAEHMNVSGNERIQHLADEAREQEANKTARIEFVKGNRIVNSTLRAKRGQGLPDAQWETFNRRMITTAADEGNSMERAFRVTAPERFGAALESEIQAHTVALQRSQEHAGAAIIKTTSVEKEYERAKANAQEQIGALVSTAAEML